MVIAGLDEIRLASLLRVVLPTSDNSSDFPVTPTQTTKR
jgi:hypothetical protein